MCVHVFQSYGKHNIFYSSCKKKNRENNKEDITVVGAHSTEFCQEVDDTIKIKMAMEYYQIWGFQALPMNMLKFY